MRRSRSWRRFQTEKAGTYRFTQLQNVCSSLDTVDERSPHCWHKHNPFNCGNMGCMICGRAMVKEELREWKYRTGQVEALDHDAA